MNHKLIFLNITISMFCTTSIVFGMELELVDPHDYYLGYPQTMKRNNNSRIGREITWVCITNGCETPLDPQAAAGKGLPLYVDHLTEKNCSSATLHIPKKRFKQTNSWMEFSHQNNPYQMDISQQVNEIDKRKEMENALFVALPANDSKKRTIVTISNFVNPSEPEAPKPLYEENSNNKPTAQEIIKKDNTRDNSDSQVSSFNYWPAIFAFGSALTIGAILYTLIMALRK